MRRLKVGSVASAINLRGQRCAFVDIGVAFAPYSVPCVVAEMDRNHDVRSMFVSKTSYGPKMAGKSWGADLKSFKRGLKIVVTVKLSLCLTN
jgi:hypothetical protein